MSPRGTFHVVLELTKRFVFCQRGRQARGGAKCLPHNKATLLLLKVCKTKDERNSQNRLRVPNTLKRHHHHHYHRHRHHHHQFGFYSIISHRKISRMVLVIFYDTPLHNCDANVCSKQHFSETTNYCIQDDQFPGVVFKVCIYKIVCHRHLKLYISMSKVPILIENIYISNQNQHYNHELP